MKKSAHGPPAPKNAGNKKKTTLAAKQVRVAAAMGAVMKSKAATVHLEKGRMYLGPITTPASPVAGAVYLEVQLYPSNVAPSRLAQLAGMYSRFKWRKAQVIYESAVGSSTNGSLFMWIDADPTAPVPTVDALGEVSIAHKSSATFPVWSEAKVSWSQPLMDKWFYCVASEDPREFSAGVIRVACDTTLAASTTFGRVYLDYEVEFRDEALTSAAMIMAAEGTSNMPSATLTNGVTFRLIRDLVPTSGTGMPTFSSGALLDDLPVGVSSGAMQRGIELPAGSYEAICTNRQRVNGAVTNTTPWTVPALKVYDKDTSQDISATTESAVEVQNIPSPATQGVYMSTFRALFDLVAPALIDFSALWGGDSGSGTYSVDQNWNISTIAPLVARTAAAFLASQPGATVNVGPGRKLQVGVVDLSITKPCRRFAGSRFPALQARPAPMPSRCITGCATFVRDGESLRCASCGVVASAAAAATRL